MSAVHLFNSPSLTWIQTAGQVNYIQPGKSNQNAFIVRFNRSLCNEVLDLYLFRSLTEVREITNQRRRQHNDPLHDALGSLSSVAYAEPNLENSTFKLST